MPVWREEVADCCCDVFITCTECCGTPLTDPPVRGKVRGMWGMWTDLPTAAEEALGGGCYRHCKLDALNGQLFTMAETCDTNALNGGCGSYSVLLGGYPQRTGCPPVSNEQEGSGSECTDRKATPVGIEVMTYHCDSGVRCTVRIVEVRGFVSCTSLFMDFQACSWCTSDDGATWYAGGSESALAICQLVASLTHDEAIAGVTICDPGKTSMPSTEGNCLASPGLCAASGPYHGILGAILA